MFRIVSAIAFALSLLLALPVLGDGHEATIADIVVASAEADMPEFTTLLAAVSAADASILEALADADAELTVFAPTDAAFSALAEALGEEAFDEILSEAGTPRLNEILLHHVVGGLVGSADVAAALSGAAADDMGQVSIPVVTLSGQTLDIAGAIGEDGLDLAAGITVAEANLVLDMVDIEASNGVIHVIDAVIVPELRTIADIVAELAGADEPEFTTLLTAVGAADPAVLALLADPAAAVTVFAPLDAAFAAVEGLDDIVADQALLTAVLQYHVFPGTVYSFQLGSLVDDMGQAAVAMANGSEAAIAVSDMGVMIDDANIVLELVDIEASNGVIHVIDAVIVPSA
ncbi:MAG: fasciclin domain-containing protein [Chloroflexota bacterium]|nr:fasciclin domain-containing protein [Chloroflexota bacterium]MDE2910371.1 fasciclin domain-containing protein [Chloroflexota bacterium]